MAKPTLLEAAERSSGRSYVPWHSLLKPAEKREIAEAVKAIRSGSSSASIAALSREMIKRYKIRVKVGSVHDWISSQIKGGE